MVFQIYEPDVTLTDYGLVVLSIILAILFSGTLILTYNYYTQVEKPHLGSHPFQLFKRVLTRDPNGSEYMTQPALAG